MDKEEAKAKVLELQELHGEVQYKYDRDVGLMVVVTPTGAQVDDYQDSLVQKASIGKDKGVAGYRIPTKNFVKNCCVFPESAQEKNDILKKRPLWAEALEKTLNDMAGRSEELDLGN